MYTEIPENRGTHPLPCTRIAYSERRVTMILITLPVTAEKIHYIIIIRRL